LIGRKRRKMADREYDRARLKSLIHYVIWVAGARPYFGAIKLYKVLWFSDAKSFILNGKSITGAPYIREKFGPIPRDGMQIRCELVNDGLISQWQNHRAGDLGWHFKAIVGPNVSWMAPNERQLVQYWINHISEDHTAESISDASHDYGWTIARMGERLPFFSILAERVRDPSEEEMLWAKQRAKELGLP